MFNPMLATGVIVATTGEPKPVITGSCAAYFARNVFITASHCIPADATAAAVLLPHAGETWNITQHERHDTSDLALLFANPSGNGVFSEQYLEPGSGRLPALGSDFLAYGFPSVDESPGEMPYPRMLKGHLQRYFGFAAPEGLEYFAGEMNIPAPPGLSGSPVMLAHSPNSLVGVVTANLDTYTTLDAFEEVDDGGKIDREVSKKIITYGIAAMFTKSTAEWAERVVQRFQSEQSTQ
jgi:hypothetical protein